MWQGAWLTMVVVDGDDILPRQGAVERVVAYGRRQKQRRGKKLENGVREVEEGFGGKFERAWEETNLRVDSWRIKDFLERAENKAWSQVSFRSRRGFSGKDPVFTIASVHYLLLISRYYCLFWIGVSGYMFSFHWSLEYLWICCHCFITSFPWFCWRVTWLCFSYIVRYPRIHTPVFFLYEPMVPQPACKPVDNSWNEASLNALLVHSLLLSFC